MPESALTSSAAAPSTPAAAPGGRRRAKGGAAGRGGRAPAVRGGGSYWLETLGCPKNQVDSEKLGGMLESEGYRRAHRPEDADLLVVNTCAFIEAAREESIDTVLQLANAKKPGAQLTVTGCLAERYGQELAAAMPEADSVAGFGVPLHAGPPPSGHLHGDRAPRIGAPVRLSATRGLRHHSTMRPGVQPREENGIPSFDLLNLPRPPARAPWAYVKVAEGCDRHCGFCAIPSFRGPQRSRATREILAEVEGLGAEEVVLVAQDLVSWQRDLTGRRRGVRAGEGDGDGLGDIKDLVDLVGAVRERVARVRLLYLYPSGLTDDLVEVMGESGCPYFDLSLQHVSAPLLRRMRRFGSAERFLEKISAVRRRFPEAALRSSFIVGYPGETEEDHDTLLEFLDEAQLDWVGFFAFSLEDGTYAASLPGRVPAELVTDRLRECSELQDGITARKRAALVGTRCRALVDAPGQARSHREAPEIDGVIRIPRHLAAGSWPMLEIVDALGPDLIASEVAVANLTAGV
jgi:ribosomal protein S12 methylthiotransferase